MGMCSPPLSNTRRNFSHRPIAWFQPSYYEPVVLLIGLINLDLNENEAMGLHQYLFRCQGPRAPSSSLSLSSALCPASSHHFFC